MPFHRDDVEVLECSPAYEGYFLVNHYRIRHKLFAGGWGTALPREVLERGHAVGLLPYDPVRDRVVMIEQFRMGPFARGDAQPWLLEIVAGIIHEGETPDDVARRETREEAGLELLDLVPMPGFYTSPGAVTEWVDMFCGRVDSRDAGGIFGVQDEGEDIRAVVFDTDEALAALADGRVTASHTVIALQWLALNRAALRRRWA